MLAEVVFILSFQLLGHSITKAHKLSSVPQVLQNEALFFHHLLSCPRASLRFHDHHELPGDACPCRARERLVLSQYVICIAYHDRDGAMVQPEGIVFDLTRVSTFTPPAPEGNHHPDPPFNNP
ncbi:hypothetical protein BHE74_00033076 [Ensete ventricosum]|nr:hypothetical protein GW17_00027512 [Ensete ventricosum]RWW59957.1 hypothetical protein BHE74_00033076 [Ensete ventricosum]RZS18470.1 hypothetical protein BHM03_00050760 [Ensete ventricosum]